MRQASPFQSAEQAAVQLLAQTFGRPPAALGWAPGRVNLIGEHVDYCGGFVLPAALDLGTVVAAARGEPGWLRAVSREQPGLELNMRLGHPIPAEAPAWGRYVAGVTLELARLGVAPDGLALAVASTVPVGAGLSSSAAIEVSTAAAVLELAGARLAPLEIARLCQRAEREHAGVPCGIMDQYAAVFGQEGAAVLIDCHHLAHRCVRLDERAALLIIDSGVKHELAGGEYAQRRHACERGLAAAAGVLGPRETLRHVSVDELASLRGRLSDEEFRRVRHVVSECARTLGAAEALERGDLAEAGRLMYESHASLRDDFEVSCDELDEIVSEARGHPGVFGARMTGGGFGGSAVALVEALRATALASLMERGRRRCFTVRPGPGMGSARAE